MTTTELYTLDNVRKFNWASINGSPHPERVSHLKKHLIGKRILDAGCGGGGYVHFLAQNGFDVTGVDKFDQFLEIARIEGRLGTYVQGDITNLPFSNKTFDCSFCFDVLEHVDDQSAIRELARVTASRLLLVVPRDDDFLNEFHLAFVHYTDTTHLRYYTEESLRDLLSRFNFPRVEIYPEIAVPLKYLVRNTFSFQSSKTLSHVVLRKASEFAFRKLVDRATCKQLYTGLVAVVDL